MANHRNDGGQRGGDRDVRVTSLINHLDRQSYIYIAMRESNLPTLICSNNRGQYSRVQRKSKVGFLWLDVHSSTSYDRENPARLHKVTSKTMPGIVVSSPPRDYKWHAQASIADFKLLRLQMIIKFSSLHPS